MLQTHYRSSLDFSDSRLEETTHAFARLENLVRNLKWARELAACGMGVPADALDELKAAIVATRDKFDADMDDDFNTAGALASVFELARAANSFLAEYQVDLCEDDRQVLCEAEEVVVDLLGVLGIEIEAAEKTAYPPAVFELARDVAGYEGTDGQAAVDALLATRAAARTEKNWELADIVRDGLGRLGFRIEDTPQGARVIYKP
jgi:cysteinyl-tRNA synthetase